MHIKLAYGTEQIPIDVPDNWINGRCYRPHPLQPCADARAELMAVISSLPEGQSLATITEGKKSACIAVDSSCPALFRELLPALVEMIEDETSIHSADLTILVSHRLWGPLTDKTLEELVPMGIRNHYKVVRHDPDNAASIEKAGETSKRIPITINRAWKEAELKIILGAVQPDLFAGFSGGRAVILPGLCGADTLRAMFSFANIADKYTRYGQFRDNPFHQAALEATSAVGCDLAISALLTPSEEISALFAGHFGPSHLQAMNALREAMSVKVKEPMDIVVTSGGGAPYDSTLMKVISTLAGVEAVLKPEGTIVISAALDDGLGSPEFAEVLRNHTNVTETLSRMSVPDVTYNAGKWLAQKLYGILNGGHEIILFNKTMNEDLIWKLGLTPTRDLNEAILGAMESHGQRCKIVALPDGPMGIGEIGSR